MVNKRHLEIGCLNTSNGIRNCTTKISNNIDNMVSLHSIYKEFSVC